MIFMTKFPNFIFKESKQVCSTSLKDHIYTEVVVVISLLSLTLANGCNPTTSFAQAFQHANDIHSRHYE